MKSNLGSECANPGLRLDEAEVAVVPDLSDLGRVEVQDVDVHKSTECRLNPDIDTEAAPELELECRME
jgi:hypothetical protein